MIYAEKEQNESPFVSVDTVARGRILPPRKEHDGVSAVSPYSTKEQGTLKPSAQNGEMLQRKKSDSDEKLLEGIGENTAKINAVGGEKDFSEEANTNSLPRIDENADFTSQTFITFIAEVLDEVFKNNSLQTAFMNLFGGRGFKTNAQYYLKKRDEMAKKAGGSNIAQAQASLVLAGYDLGKYGVDGIKGKENSYTTRAIKEFQLAVGLSPTGNLDARTVFALNIIVQTGMKKKDLEELGERLGHYDLVWPTESDRITSAFGWRTHPITGEKHSFHGGIDIGPIKASYEGDAIVAALSGKVIKSAYQFNEQTKRGAGFYLAIESIYKGQKVRIYYMHLQKNSIVVETDDFVNAGQHIANMGKTGGVTGPHLHYEIRVFEDGKWVKKDPMTWNYESDQLKGQE